MEVILIQGKEQRREDEKHRCCGGLPLGRYCRKTTRRTMWFIGCVHCCVQIVLQQHFCELFDQLLWLSSGPTVIKHWTGTPAKWAKSLLNEQRQRTFLRTLYLSVSLSIHPSILGWPDIPVFQKQFWLLVSFWSCPWICPCFTVHSKQPANTFG